MAVFCSHSPGFNITGGLGLNTGYLESPLSRPTDVVSLAQTLRKVPAGEVSWWPVIPVA